jgi:hypothetical protein
MAMESIEVNVSSFMPSPFNNKSCSYQAAELLDAEASAID